MYTCEQSLHGFSYITFLYQYFKFVNCFLIDVNVLNKVLALCFFSFNLLSDVPLIYGMLVFLLSTLGFLNCLIFNLYTVCLSIYYCLCYVQSATPCSYVSPEIYRMIPLL